jgi:hypothetical protein
MAAGVATKESLSPPSAQSTLRLSNAPRAKRMET